MDLYYKKERILGEKDLERIPNQNLLDNSNFINPVNRNGITTLTVGTSAKYFIDRWCTARSNISLESDGISISWDGVNSTNCYFMQYMERKDAPVGRDFVLSFLIDDGLFYLSGKFPDTENGSTLTNTFGEITLRIDNLASQNKVRIFVSFYDTRPHKIKAAKLELGSVQTLAHKEGDKWMLNEIPNYAEQYAICSQYDQITDNFVGDADIGRMRGTFTGNIDELFGSNKNGSYWVRFSDITGTIPEGISGYGVLTVDSVSTVSAAQTLIKWDNTLGVSVLYHRIRVNNMWYSWTFIRTNTSNPNLLPNWHLINPINQKGKASYSVGTSFEYTIDMWRTARANITIADDGLLLAWDGVNSSDGYILNIAEMPVSFSGKIVTASAIIDGELYYATSSLPIASGAGKSFLELDKFRFNCQNIGGNPAFGIYSKTTTPIKITAAKLELGSVQTLAHKEGDVWVVNDPPPNCALELAKCQRYQYVIGGISQYQVIGVGPVTATNQARITIPTTVSLRETPKILYSGSWSLVNDTIYNVTNIDTVNLSNGCITVNVYSDKALPLGQCLQMRAAQDITARIIFDATL